MFDGTTIKCNYTVDKLLKNDLLRFISPLDETTGEIKPHKKAIYKSLLFSVGTLPKANNIPYANIKGSLHKFFNNGKHNANDFKFTDVCNTVKELENKFKIIPEKSNLTNLEIGVNIELSIQVQSLLKMLVSLPTAQFKEYKVNSLKVGYFVETTDKVFKIYDKGKLTDKETQANIKQKNKNLLRIEIKYKRIRPLHTKYDIKTLADLTTYNKVKDLYMELISMFDSIIMNEKDIDVNELTTKQLLTFKDYINPLFWGDLTKHKRLHHRRQYDKLLNEFSEQKYKNEVCSLILEKWFKLIDVQHKNTRPFPKVKQSNKAQKYTTISNVVKYWKKSCNDEEKQDINKIENLNNNLPKSLINISHKKKNYCKTCGREITHQKKNSKFCSEKYHGKSAKQCRNKASNKTRQQKRIDKRKIEINNLNELNKILPKSNHYLQIFRKIPQGIQTKRIKQQDLKPLNYKDFRKIIKVKIFINRKPKEFTTKRAKELIKAILTINKKE